LIGKPKVFIIAACQTFENSFNNRRMLGISLNDNQMEIDSSNSNDFRALQLKSYNRSNPSVPLYLPSC